MLGKEAADPKTQWTHCWALLERKRQSQKQFTFLGKKEKIINVIIFFRTFKDIFQAFCQTSIRSCTDKLEMCSSEDPLSTGLPFKLTDARALLHIDSSNCFIFVKASVQEQLCDPGTEKHTFTRYLISVAQIKQLRVISCPD